MISPEDQIGRYAFDDSYFRASDLSVKHRAFVPAADRCTSVFVISGLSHDAVLQHGETHVVPARGKPLRGYVMVSAGPILSVPLSILGDAPPPLHANIVAWSEDIDAMKLQAIQIADEAVFVYAQSS